MPLWFTRMLRQGKLRTDWNGRFGHAADLPASDRRILLHAVSVGEVNSLRTLVSRFQNQEESVDIVISVTTDTGYRRACELFADQVTVVRYPYDFSWAVNRFLDQVKPNIMVLVELEAWPNMIESCRRRGVPTIVINGRLSHRSHKRYSRIRSMVRAMFRKLQRVAVQDSTYAQRFIDLGVLPDRIEITGSMKWDTIQLDHRPTIDPELVASLGIDLERPLVVAGSTGPGEETLLDKAVPDDVQLLCAPRKPERFDEAAAALPGCTRRSSGSTGSPTRRFLLDTIGELPKAYAMADVVVVGRTFTPLGGSDMIEPLAIGKPVIIGPHVDNFESIAGRLLEAGSLLQVAGEQLPDAIKMLLDQPDRCRLMVESGHEVIKTMQGATDRNTRLVIDELDRVHKAKMPIATDGECSNG